MTVSGHPGGTATGAAGNSRRALLPASLAEPYRARVDGSRAILATIAQRALMLPLRLHHAGEDREQAREREQSDAGRCLRQRCHADHGTEAGEHDQGNHGAHCSVHVEGER